MAEESADVFGAESFLSFVGDVAHLLETAHQIGFALNETDAFLIQAGVGDLVAGKPGCGRNLGCGPLGTAADA